MEQEKNREFIRKTESLVKPQDVTAISFLGDFNKLLSKKTQHRIMEKGSRKIPYMGFIVDPYCLFLAYEITDTAAARVMLPPGYELAETALFEGDVRKPLVIFSVFSARTSAFIGTRLELYIIARNRDTGVMSWIIADYETNTNSHDPKNGFCGYTCDPATFTTTPYGELLVDIRGLKENRGFALNAGLDNGTKRRLDRELWVEGNLSVDYGGELKDESSKPFGLIFDPVLMDEAVELPLGNIDIGDNTFVGSIIDAKKPVSAAVFPYSQHFVIRQDLDNKDMTSESQLVNQVDEFLGRSGYKMMKGEDLKKPLIAGIIASSLFNAALILFLVIKLLT